jgi:hypothetical protein
VRGAPRVPGTDSSLTLRWRKPDSKHRSRSCERLFWGLPIGYGGTKGGATYRFRCERQMHALVAAVLLWVARLEKFADSPLEREGFEPSVPRSRNYS